MNSTSQFPVRRRDPLAVTALVLALFIMGVTGRGGHSGRGAASRPICICGITEVNLFRHSVRVYLIGMAAHQSEPAVWSGRDVGEIPSPECHRELLADRKARPQRGEAKFLTLDQLKARLRDSES